MNGAIGQLVVWSSGKIGEVPIEQVANKQRLVPMDSPLLAAAQAVGTSFGD